MTETIIRPKKLFSSRDITEIWDYKELLYFFTWRDLKVRYKQTIVGIGWSVFQPLFTMLIFTIFFGKMLNIPADNVPYPIFVFTGLLFWQFFSGGLSETSNVLISNQSIITKVYFPRLILPLSAVTTKFIDFLIAATILLAMMWYYGFAPGILAVVVIPILLAITFMAAVGGGLFLAAFNAKYRDVRFILPFFIQMLLFVTPVIYPASVAGKYSWILAFNPMTGVIQNARAVLLETAPVNWLLIALSFVATAVILAIGIIYFKKVERYFADIV